MGENLTISVKTHEPYSTVILMAFTKQQNELDSMFNEFRLRNLEPKDFESIKQDFLMTNIFLGHSSESSAILKTIDTSRLNGINEISYKSDLQRQKNKGLKNHEIWLFETFQTRSDGSYQLNRTIPSKFLTWTLAAVCINQKDELGFSIGNEVEVSKKFFIDVKLQTKLRYNKVARADILIFNNLDKSIEVSLSFSQTQNLKFMRKKEGCRFIIDSNPEILNATVNMKPKSVESRTFYFKPMVVQKSKTNTLEVTAENSEGLFHKVEIELQVESESKNREYSLRVPVDLRNSSKFNKNIEISEFVPGSALKQSVSIEISLSSNLVNKDLMNPTKIMNISTQTSKEDFINKMMQSTLTLVYLSKSNHIDINEPKYKNFINQTLNLILERQNKSDGSLRFEGYSKYKSVWITAYILEFIGLVDNFKFIKVHDNVITNAFNFLIRHQVDNGSFIDYDDSVDDLKIKLNTQIISTFSKFPKQYEINRNIVKKCVDFLDKSQFNMKKNLNMAMILHAVAIYNHTSWRESMESFKMNYGILQNNFIFWEVVGRKKSEKPIKDIQEKVEIASYMLMSLLNEEELDEAVFPVMTWLSNTFSQHAQVFMIKDSFVVMKMLLMYQERFLTSKNRIEVQVENGINNQKWSMKIDESDQLSEQSKIINSKSHQLSINAVGEGFAMLDIFYSYAEPVEDFDDKFEILIDVENILVESDSIMEMKVCINRNLDIEVNLISEEPATVEIEIPKK